VRKYKISDSSSRMESAMSRQDGCCHSIAKIYG
jgi:hypothetical protein